MIPTFPEFTSLEPVHQDEYHELTAGLRDYADSSLATHLAWDLHEEAKISQLRGNVVLALTQVPSQRRFLSLHGTHDVDTALKIVLDYSNDQDRGNSISLVPEETVSKIQESRHFCAVPDRDNFDYVVSIPAITELIGSSFRNMRRRVNRFQTQYPDSEVVDLDIASEEHATEILNVFDGRNKLSPESSDQYERMALERLISLNSDFNFVAKGVRLETKLEAFMIAERNRGSMLGHFWKANTEYDGIYHFLMRECCREFDAQGFREFNIEEDMGIEGLRSAKEVFNPTYLKKYNISLSSILPPLAFEEADEPLYERVLSAV